MDCFGCKSGSNRCEKGLKGLAGKVKLLQEEIKTIMCERQKESIAYERDMAVFTFKEAEWKQERKKLKEEVKSLKRLVEEREVRIKGTEGGPLGEKSEEDWHVVEASSFLMEQTREERAWRDEAVDRWKKLYLAIKSELDDLIQRTHCGDGLYWRAEEEKVTEELKMELMVKERAIEDLKLRLALAEQETYKSARQLDMLRQSLRIMSNKKAASRYAVGKPKLAIGKQAKKA